jgi:hypothetical protein
MTLIINHEKDHTLKCEMNATFVHLGVRPYCDQILSVLSDHM